MRDAVLLTRPGDDVGTARRGSADEKSIAGLLDDFDLACDDEAAHDPAAETRACLTPLAPGSPTPCARGSGRPHHRCLAVGATGGAADSERAKMLLGH
ncbi:hypothetical protein [Aquamicrobium ahrensii]|uniref:Uncharacterized protein n=1 Tax=Aquamicrobium ahrensii TaxID=469551 RepID=A0ABV2KPL5_9HYPH